MQTYNDFNALVAGTSATPLVSAMSVFNVSDDDYARAQQGLQGILNVLKQQEWQTDLSDEQRASLQDIRGKTKTLMLVIKKWRDDERGQSNTTAPVDTSGMPTG